MDKNYYNFLKFRTDLIELLGKYKLKISGTGFDDGSMRIESIKDGSAYILKDICLNYEAVDTDWNHLPIDYILNMFPEEHTPLFSNKKVGVFTNNPSKALLIFEDLVSKNKDNINKHRRSLDHIDLLLKDGTYYTWIKVIDNSRGHGCGKAYIDKNLTLRELQEIVIPICVYCERKNIIVF